MKRRQGRERRTTMERVISITRQVREAINARPTVTRSLWLTPIHKVIINGARGGRPLGPVGQVLLLSNCSMSPVQDTTLGKGQPLTYGKIARS